MSYIDSKKTQSVTNIFNKVGGKGSFPLLEDVIQNTELSVHFSPPKNILCFYSFDNIQTLFKCHRLEGKNADHILAIVITSVNATDRSKFRVSGCEFAPTDCEFGPS